MSFLPRLSLSVLEPSGRSVTPVSQDAAETAPAAQRPYAVRVALRFDDTGNGEFRKELGMVPGLSVMVGRDAQVVVDRVRDLSSSQVVDLLRHKVDLAVPAVIVVDTATQDGIRAALRAGYRGLLYGRPVTLFAPVIATVALGCGAVEPRLLDALVGDEESVLAARLQLLTRHELDILEQLAYGLGNATIAANLFLSEATVKFHLHSLRRKLAVRERAEMTAFAYRSGLVHPAAKPIPEVEDDPIAQV